MEARSVEAIIRTLNGAGVRYLVAGGLAVVAHGFVRLTADVDVILDLDPENVRRATAALATLGYRPRAPVRLEEFADPAKRDEWIRDKGLTVFSLFSVDHSATELDLFVEVPLDFEEAYRNAARMEVAPGVEATFVGLAELMRLKRQAGRAQDLLDIEKLQLLYGEKDRE
jgi:hypothetical protein